MDNPAYATFATIAVIVASAVPSLAKKINVAYIKHRADKAESAYRYPTPDLEKGQYLKELQPLLKATRKFFQDQIQQLETLQQTMDENEKLKTKSTEDDKIIIQLDNERKQALAEVDSIRNDSRILKNEIERLKQELRDRTKEIMQLQTAESTENERSKTETLSVGSAETTFFSQQHKKVHLQQAEAKLKPDQAHIPAKK